MGTRHPLTSQAAPRILLVEDDGISQAYMEAVLEAAPASIDLVATRQQALAHGTAERHDLWLIDLSLPDGSGIELLQELQAHWPEPPPALAHTAHADPAAHAPALEAGFREVLVKPLGGNQLLQAVRTALASSGSLPDWDNAAAAMALNHDDDNIRALRRMFLDELPGAREEVLASARRGDVGAVRARLHRLQAGCGLVGARRLGAAIESLRRAPESPRALEHFDHAALDLLR
ncbi:response regulator receiver and Hpt phospho transfer protein [Pseudoxanthomonas suwonensis 11-1]|uniref:Response regulator receiver and Hpt phospho transfer protein n=1 Tax=Pseudoxanthomonas suwonensis (strain 11-1) TaxID=743721 RepID=E6WUL3_PSEUU|nr:response regulator [Pseudoxanthomonas suwonensis]ADV27715.1 response regulator receiver and Hpt phospho transfer protein [Pseudoxanthomonas suwonensis 11-1]